MPPTVPTSVIPPSVPADTRAQLVISRGGVGEWVPISVAHVSAFAAASAPANHSQLPARAARAAMPPFAMTCRSLRAVPLRDKKVDRTKKARRNTIPRHPSPHSVVRPTAAAATAPRRVSPLTPSPQSLIPNSLAEQLAQHALL